MLYHFNTLHLYFLKAQHFHIIYIAFQFTSKLPPAFQFLVILFLDIRILSRIFPSFSLPVSPYWSRAVMFFLTNLNSFLNTSYAALIQIPYLYWWANE